MVPVKEPKVMALPVIVTGSVEVFDWPISDWIPVGQVLEAAVSVMVSLAVVDPSAMTLLRRAVRTATTTIKPATRTVASFFTGGSWGLDAARGWGGSRHF